MALELLEEPCRIVASAMDKCPPVLLVHRLLGHQDIFRSAACRINRIEADHAADLEVRIDLKTLLDSQSGCYQLIVGGLIHDFFSILSSVQKDSAFLKDMVLNRVCLIVDLIECHPIFDFILIALEADCRKFYEHVDRFSVQESVVFLYKCPRQLKMAECDQRLYIILAKFIEQVIIELESFFVRFSLIPSREDSGPGDRRTEGLEAHFGKECNVFFIMMIEIRCFMVRIILSRQNAICDAARLSGTADCHNVSD